LRETIIDASELRPTISIAAFYRGRPLMSPARGPLVVMANPFRGKQRYLAV
jgi:hypothetical protein